jgi:peroxiredoxin
MRKLISAITLAMLTLSATVSLSAAGKVPRKAPEFVIHGADGGDKLLSSYRGKTVLLALMFTTCPHCQNISKLLSNIAPDYTAKGVQIVGATFDQNAPRDYKNFNAAFVKGFPCGYAPQAEVLKFLELKPDEPFFVPILVFIDKTGTIHSQYIGDEKFLGNPDANIRAELDKMIKAGGTPASAKK